MMETFRLTKADLELINTMLGTISESQFLYPPVGFQVIGQSRMMAVWTVLGEKHGFIPDTAREHPDGKELVLAEPTVNIPDTW